MLGAVPGPFSLLPDDPQPVSRRAIVIIWIISFLFILAYIIL